MSLDNRFMSELKDCRRLHFDKTDLSMLGLMCLAGEKTTKPKQASIWFGHGVSAYTMCDLLGRRLTYKNVRKRMRKFVKLNLIEEIQEEKRYRNAIKYKPTSMGLFQGFLSQPSVTNLYYNKNTMLLQILVYQYFSPESIDKMISCYCDVFIFSYVKRCCEIVLNTVERLKSKGKTPTFADIQRQIEKEVNNLVFNIVISSKFLVDDESESGVTNLIPIDALSKDEKFMKRLNEMKKDFDRGYQYFVKG